MGCQSFCILSAVIVLVFGMEFVFSLSFGLGESQECIYVFYHLAFFIIAGRRRTIVIICTSFIAYTIELNRRRKSPFYEEEKQKSMTHL